VGCGGVGAITCSYIPMPTLTPTPEVCLGVDVYGTT